MEAGSQPPFSRASRWARSTYALDRKVRDYSLIATGSKGKGHTNPKRREGCRKLLAAQRTRPRWRFRLVSGETHAADMDRGVANFLVEISEKCQLFGFVLS
jgi:hypothetical protein